MFVLGCSGVRLLGSGVPPRVLMLGVCIRVLGFGCSESGVRVTVSGLGCRVSEVRLRLRRAGVRVLGFGRSG